MTSTRVRSPAPSTSASEISPPTTARRAPAAASGRLRARARGRTRRRDEPFVVGSALGGAVAVTCPPCSTCFDRLLLAHPDRDGPGAFHDPEVRPAGER